jgi:hypothetical protein
MRAQQSRGWRHGPGTLLSISVIAVKLSTCGATAELGGGRRLAPLARPSAEASFLGVKTPTCAR